MAMIIGIVSFMPKNAQRYHIKIIDTMMPTIHNLILAIFNHLYLCFLLWHIFQWTPFGDSFWILYLVLCQFIGVKQNLSDTAISLFFICQVSYENTIFAIPDFNYFHSNTIIHILMNRFKKGTQKNKGNDN